jgi:hypothetical protein
MGGPGTFSGTPHTLISPIADRRLLLVYDIPSAHADVRPYGTDYDAALDAYEHAEQDAPLLDEQFEDLYEHGLLVFNDSPLVAKGREISDQLSVYRVIAGLSRDDKP